MLQESVKFSIIIPVYNVAEYLDECLQSVLAQKYRNFEILLIDDGSTDGSGQICENYQARYSNIKLIKQKNSGLAATRNKGLDMAIGQYVLFLDSDDIWLGNDVLQQIEVILQHDKCQMLQFAFCKFVDGTKEFVKKFKNKNKEYHAVSLKELIDNNVDLMTNAWTKVFEREFLEKNHLRMDAKLRSSEDIDFSFKAWMYLERVSVISNVFYGYRIRRGSLSVDALASIWRRRIIERWAHYEYMSLESELKDYIMSKLAYQYLIMVSKIPRIESKEERKEIYKFAKEKKYLLKYVKGRKAKIMAGVCKLTGITLATYLFYIINLVKKR